ncbi:MAG TPA: methyltransferase [Luteolibacter sp.]|nr:methyltransferase [Luteolibacter sp.]
MAAEEILPDLDRWDPLPLRERFRRVGFQKQALESLGLPEHWLRSAVPRAALLGHTRDGTPLDSLIRLFTFGDSLDGERAFYALGDAVHGLLEIGFLEAGGGVLRSRYQIVPAGEGWIACDFHRRQGEDADDFVMGIGPSSMLLAALAPVGAGRALEMACGIGWLSGKLAAAGMQVVASDLNARAIELGRFSARLNGIAGVDFRHGDGFSSVAGEKFELIVANPPYVQSPGGNMIYKESRAGDSICARLLREVPEYLAPDGIAVVLINWSHTSDDDWTEGPLSWVTPAGTRRWLFQSDCSSPADYAWKWISSDLRFREEQTAVDEVRRWLDFYQNAGVNRISGGFMVVQKCGPGGEWTRTESRAAENFDVRSGDELRRVIENETWLAVGHSLLEARFTVPDGVRAEVRMVLENGWTRETIRLTSPMRFAYNGQIDENLLRLLEIVRSGKKPAAMVEEIRSKPEYASIPDLPARISDLTRELVRHGLLVPA